MTLSDVWHDSFIRVTWLIHMCDVTHSYVWHDSFIRVTWPIHMCDMTHSYVWHDSCIRVTWLIHTSDMTLSDVWHDSFIRVTLIRVTRLDKHLTITIDVYVECVMAHSYMWHDASICVACLEKHLNMTIDLCVQIWRGELTRATWIIHTFDLTHSYVSHDPFICVTWPNERLSMDWFWQSGWLIHKSTFCTRIMLLPQWEQNAYGVSTSSRSVRKIQSQNQSITADCR